MTSTDVLLDRAAGAARAANAAAAAQSGAMLAFVRARRADAVAAGVSSAGVHDVGLVAVEELAVALSMGSAVVQQRVHVAATVADDLPAVGAAFAGGLVDEAKTRAIASAAWRLHEPGSRTVLDARAVAYATGHTLVQLRGWLNRLVTRLEPDHATVRRRRVEQDRGVWFTVDEDAGATLVARLRAEDALLLDRELTIAARAHRGGEDPLTLDQARADVLVDRLLGRTGTTPGRGRFHVGITVPVTTLLGLSAEPGTSVDGRLALDPALVREICTRPGTLFTRILTDPVGRVLDATEVGRFPTPALERALVLLDGTCAFPTCNAPAHSADTDHVQPHPRGPTTAANLRHLCRRHHRLKTRMLLPTTIDDTGTHLWHLPTRTVASRAHLPRPSRHARVAPPRTPTRAGPGTLPIDVVFAA